ncbi:heme-binding domain-containing protein [Roseivirga pacifica]|uniref:heme-binding domain-containing protein n=1 Tax=Roseivirga pacifica TaxID=1267423 RepID=UPI00227A5FA0|nr:heme-binding domain-containing protein [Roseivirga pacifica]
MKRLFYFLLLIVLIAFVAIQFVDIPEKIAEPVTENDIIEQLNVNPEMAGLLKDACYDCHSNQPKYPWYAKIAPVSWTIAEHIEHGRDELNFSEWGTYSKRRRDHKLEEMVEEVEVGNMPLPNYVLMHPEANLTTEQFEMLKKWVSEMREQIAQEPDGE